MNCSTWITRCLVIAAPIVLGGTIAIAPSRAASIAESGGALTLDNFSQLANPGNLVPDTNTDTNTTAIAGTGSIVVADAKADADKLRTSLDQFSTALARGTGPNYFSRADALSETSATFTTNEWFRFNFRAQLASFASTTAPKETANAEGLVAFSIFDTSDVSTPIDFFQVSAIASNRQNTFSITSSPFVTLSSIVLAPIGTGATVEGTYARQFGQATNLLVAGKTTSSAIAQVPEPPMFAALLILPGLFAWKRVRMGVKARSKVTIE